MFIRRTTYRMAAEHDSEAGQAAFEAAMRKAVKPEDIDGLINTTHMPNGDGTYFVVAVWTDKSHADRETPRIRAVWADLAPMLAGPPVVEASGIELREAL